MVEGLKLATYELKQYTPGTELPFAGESVHRVGAFG